MTGENSDRPGDNGVEGNRERRLANMSKYSEFSARASLMIVGLMMSVIRIWEAVERKVEIKQKTIRHKSLEKVLDRFILLLCGGLGIVEMNTRVRPNVLLQAAFGALSVPNNRVRARR